LFLLGIDHFTKRMKHTPGAALMTKREDRLNWLTEEIKNKRTMNIEDIQRSLHVSESTARRMCIELEHRGICLRCFGGIRYLQEQSSYYFDIVKDQNVDEKARIAAHAVSMVKEGDIIFLSGGTSVLQFAIKLAESISQGALQNVQIMTNSIANVEFLSKVTRVVLTGGEYRPERYDVAGNLTEKNISRSRFDKAFVGVDGIDIEDGLMALDIDTASSDRMIAKRAEVVYVLADSQKFFKKAFISYQNIQPNFVVITDEKLTEKLRDQAKLNAITILTV
jgi:DeoR family transcriptional regulator, fructose operon transcriptional repressor